MTMDLQTENSTDILRDYNASRKCVDKGSICHAPETSLYFGRDGLVSACCYSRSASLGRYPEQSIAEIWEGAQAEAMRAAMRRNELPGGCDLCADELYARNFSGLLARQYDANARPRPAPVSGPLAQLKALFQPGKPSKRYPVQFDFELSNKCNLECAMCSGFFSSSIRANRENLPPLPQLYDSAFVEQLVPFLPHLTHAKFLGGEPFLIDVYYEIWEKLIELNPDCNVSITTNGTVYSERVKRVLEKLNCAVIVSLDSVTKSTYETIRKNGKLERTLSHLESFSVVNRRKNKGLSIAICPMVSNCREIPDLVTFANERGISIIFNTVVFPADHSLKALSPDVQAEILALYRNANASRAASNAIEAANHAALEDFCLQIEYWMREHLPTDRTPLEQRCAQLLAERKGSDAVAALLSDLAGIAPDTEEDSLLQLEAGSPLLELKAYFQAIWEVGDKLRQEGLLPNVRFEVEDLRAFLAYLDSNVGTNQARRMVTEMRRFPKEMLRFTGTLSVPQLIELIESHHAPGAHSA